MFYCQIASQNFTTASRSSFECERNCSTVQRRCLSVSTSCLMPVKTLASHQSAPAQK